MKGISPGRGEIWREKSGSLLPVSLLYTTLVYDQGHCLAFPIDPDHHRPLTSRITLMTRPLILDAAGVALSPLQLRGFPKNVGPDFGLEGAESKEVSRLPFWGGGTLGAAFGGGVGRGVEMEGVCSSVGDCWKGLGIGSPLKHLQNWEVVRVRGMPKVSEVGVGRTLRQLWSGKQVVPWHCWQRPLKECLCWQVVCLDKTTTLSQCRHFAEWDRSSLWLQGRVITIWYPLLHIYAGLV